VLAGRDLLAHMHPDTAINDVRVRRGHPVAVVDLDVVAVPAETARVHDRARVGGVDGGIAPRGEVGAEVVRGAAVAGTRPEVARDVSARRASPALVADSAARTRAPPLLHTLRVLLL